MRLDIKKLNDFLAYDSKTGLVTWKEVQSKWFKTNRDCMAFNTRWSGKIAGGKREHGYIAIGYEGKRPYAHSIAWCLYHGKNPEHQIDHVNGIRDDNRILNLRDVNQRSNAKNVKIHKTNTSGVCGVSQIQDSKRWRAYITVNGKQLWLGSFEDYEEACKARKEAEKKYDFHKNHGRSK
tara:strand:- start:359 stop:895 length:537 start_codon:yes stop_codon:yes gene_type:complete